MATKPPSGRLARLGKLASLSAKVSTGLAARAAARVIGKNPDELERQATERVVATLGELKGAAMKLGQALSMDPDALPPELRAVIARLQNQAPPVAYEEIATVIEAELGGPPEARFAEFDHTPLAAASLGQVHRARLQDGREVAVKVQYPGIVDAIESDFANLGVIVNAVGKTSPTFDGREYYEEFRREIALETDYEREALHARQYRGWVSRFPDLVVPEVIDSHSGKRVLTLELVRGVTLGQFVTTSADDAARLRVSSQLIRAIYGPFLLAGEIHADPHPGNFLVTDDGKLAILDFGSVKAFSPSFVDACRRYFRANLEGPPIDVLEAVRAAGFRVELPDALARDVLGEVQAIAGRPVRTGSYDYGADTANKDMRALVARRGKDVLRIRPPAEGVMFARAIGGCAQNLRALAARGDFRAVFEGLLPLLP
ncbi:MAG: AarF/ABC1/UbiB kinase family protein [Deltaproteobacteria bacterium]|nr:AarF/ABC1/UbiB kinase family protein [Deltaproteobacteria bacterium]